MFKTEWKKKRMLVPEGSVVTKTKNALKASAPFKRHVYEERKNHLHGLTLRIQLGIIESFFPGVQAHPRGAPHKMFDEEKLSDLCDFG